MRKIPQPFASVQRGYCLWCGKRTLTQTGKIDRSRRLHNECREQRALHISLDAQRKFLIARDGSVCRKCGESLNRIVVENDGRHVQRLVAHVDHIIPLWKTIGIEPLRRREYFGPSNLQLLCTPCHLIKSKLETIDRTHMRRLQRTAYERERRRRRISSRGFDKRWRRRMSGKVERRNETNDKPDR